MLWPDDDHHRWSDLMLRKILEKKHTVIIGLQGLREILHRVLATEFGLTDYLSVSPKSHSF